MLEFLITCALASGIARALRLRHGWALLGGCAVAYLLLGDTLAAFAARGQGSIFGLFGSVFIGPGASPLRGTGPLPWPRFLTQYPLLVRALRSSLCGIVAWICLRQSNRLNPLLPRAYALDAVGMPFAGAAVVDALIAVILFWAWVMIGEDAVLVPGR
ncbi:MAG TPA: hypothetical protein VJV78_39505 [Polyangiales bacterium]|nr:hypothetical protein [Polyangiales bacterium]